MAVWTNQIRQVLTESEQMRKEADDIGPVAELEHWKRRMTTFNRSLRTHMRTHTHSLMHANIHTHTYVYP